MNECALKGSINSIETMGLVDGPGVRAVVFMQGCMLRCRYCHNPETWSTDGSGSGAFECTPRELSDRLLRYKSYMKRGGVTFSGGEPLLQAGFAAETAGLLKENGIHICIDTAGVTRHTDYDALSGDGDIISLLGYTDLIILDIKAVSEDEYKYITGRGMESFNAFLKLIQEMGKKLWLRCVIVPGINNDTDHIKRLKEYMRGIKNVEKTELLPYHTLGVSKYEKLGIKYPLEGTPSISYEDICQ